MERKKLLVLSISSLLVASLTVGIFLFATRKQGNTEPEDEEVPVYTVSFDTKGGTPIESVKVNEGSKISKPEDPIKNGYHVTSWIYENQPWIFESYEVYSDMTLIAGWDYDTYSITYIFEGGSTEEPYETSYNIDSEFDLIRPEKDESIFIGWFDQNGNRIDDVHQGMTGDLVLTARWIDGLVLTSNDETKGVIYAYGDEEDPTKITVKNVPVDNRYHLFAGWYDENNNLLSEDMAYTFNVSSDKTTYIYSSYMNEEEENEWNINHGVIPSIDSENIVTYGLYPQDNVNDEDLIDKLEKSELTKYNGYHYYDHEYYVKKKAKLYRDENGNYPSITEFDNGDIFSNNEMYWFKVQPMTWRVLESSDSEMLLLSNVVTETVKYLTERDIREIDEKPIYPNNYEYSNAREWLNSTFYDNAFIFNKNPITVSEVDNSISTTTLDDEKYACENTMDKVFMLSHKDYTNQNYGFSSDFSNSPTRQLKSTDYFRITGGLYGTTIDDLFSSYLWTRSPASNDGNSVSKINRSGGLNTSDGGSSYCGLQPAITIHM